MRWTLAWFLHQENEWKRKAVSVAAENKRGHQCYAEKQVLMWKRLHDKAADTWSSIP
jgi:hypothetical protein